MTTRPTTPNPLPPLYGLVLAGGQSVRMGQDKAGLVYHEKTQLNHTLSLLNNFVEQCFVSVRLDQSSLDLYIDKMRIEDGLDNGQGPINGVLSAMQTHPDAAWLVLACDMPHVTTVELEALVDNRQSEYHAVAYKSENDFPEPLCTVYEPGMIDFLSHRVGAGRYSLRKALQETEICLLDHTRPSQLISANTREQMKQAKDVLARKRIKEGSS